MKLIMIPPNLVIKEVDHEDYDKLRGAALYSGACLFVPRISKYKKYNLCMLMKDVFEDEDQINTLATTLYNKLLVQDHELDDVVRGTVFYPVKK